VVVTGGKLVLGNSNFGYHDVGDLDLNITRNGYATTWFFYAPIRRSTG